MAIRFVPITLDKPRRLRFDPNAIAEVEGVLDMGIGRLFKEDMMGLRVLRALIWGGLRWEDRGLTVDRAGALIGVYLENGKTLGELTKIIMEAVEAAGWITGVNDDDEGEAPEGNAQGA